MQLGDHKDGDGHDDKWMAFGPALLAVSVMLIGCVAAFLLLNLEALRPRVGDMVVFRPNGLEQGVWQLQVQTYQPTAAGQTSCMMDPAVIVRNGGSLVVEARDDSTPAAQYRLHWAGAHSANGLGDCVGHADISVSRTDLQKLANAAGGFGIQRGIIR